MKSHSVKDQSILDRVQPVMDQDAREIQPYGMIVKLPIALAEDVCKASAESLNQLLADTITLRDMYKKHHWQVAGPTFYQLHLLYDKHYKEQSARGFNRRARSDTGSDQPRDGARCGGNNPDSSSSPRPAGGSSPAVSVSPCARDHSARIAKNGQASG
jgi:hypothetical protein